MKGKEKRGRERLEEASKEDSCEPDVLPFLFRRLLRQCQPAGDASQLGNSHAPSHVSTSWEHHLSIGASTLPGLRTALPVQAARNHNAIVSIVELDHSSHTSR